MSAEDILTREEAIRFVIDTLNIRNFDELKQNDKLKCVNTVLREFMVRFPFQNLDLLATPSSERHVPRAADIRQAILSGHGGLCITLNGFMWSLLAGLGFETYLAGGTVIGRAPDTHVLVIIKDLVYPGTLHVVDVGGAFPSSHAAPLQGQGKEVFKNSFLEWTVLPIPNQDGHFTRHHLKDEDKTLLTSMDLPRDRSAFYEFRIEPLDLDYFQGTLKPIYTDEAKSLFLQDMFMAVYPPGRGITLKGDLLRIYDNGTGQTTNRKLSNQDEFVEVLHRELQVKVDEVDLRRAWTIIASASENK